MTTQTLQKLNNEVKELKSDIREMKRFIFSPMKDSEGAYQRSFVKKMLSRAQNQGPFLRFTDKETFLKHVQSRK